MKLPSRLFVLLALTAAASLLHGEVPPHSSAAAVMDPLPASLDKLFPPQAPAPLFLIAKHEMAQPFSGIMVDLMENDPANAATNFEAFRTKYESVSRLVPEWTGRFPMAPVEELGKALASHDPQQVMGAMQAVGQTCHTCHIQSMARVHAKYHWPDFKSISLTDPLSGQDVSYPQMMQMLEGSLTGVGVDLAQGQIEHAQKNAAGFAARFQLLKESCATCHDSERKYYVDAEVIAMIDELGKAVSTPSVDGKAVGGLMQKIGQESCFKCHLVHIPAAYSKY